MNACHELRLSVRAPSHPDQKICEACDALREHSRRRRPRRCSSIGNYRLAARTSWARAATRRAGSPEASSGGGGVILKLLRGLRARTPRRCSAFLDEARKLSLERNAAARAPGACARARRGRSTWAAPCFSSTRAAASTTLADELARPRTHRRAARDRALRAGRATACTRARTKAGLSPLRSEARQRRRDSR